MAIKTQYERATDELDKAANTLEKVGTSKDLAVFAYIGFALIHALLAITMAIDETHD